MPNDAGYALRYDRPDDVPRIRVHIEKPGPPERILAAITDFSIRPPEL